MFHWDVWLGGRRSAGVVDSAGWLLENGGGGDARLVAGRLRRVPGEKDGRVGLGGVQQRCDSESEVSRH